MSVALFAGVFAVLLLAVIGLGLTRNSAESRNLIDVVFDGLQVLQAFVLQIFGTVFN
jgi:branched-subunit amino acid permease